jgi:hypothetical protein
MSAKRKAFPTTPNCKRKSSAGKKKKGANASDSSEDSTDEGVLEPAYAKASCQRDILFIFTNYHAWYSNC